jgi:hypothetical protein
MDPVVVWAKAAPVSIAASARTASTERSDRLCFKYVVSDLAARKKELVGEMVRNSAEELGPGMLEERQVNTLPFLSINMLFGLRNGAVTTLAN